MARLLMLSASAGAGHNRAAEALHESARAFCPGVESAWLDSLQFTNRAFSKLYERSYVWLATRAPELWGFLYKQAGKNTERKKLDKVIELHDRLVYKKLIAQVDEFKPDAVLCTHFLPANVVIAKRRGQVPVYVVITDFDVTSLWVNRKADGYFVGSDEVKVQLARFGYPPERIRVTGIPIHPVFAEEVPKPVADRPAILLMGGGFGMGNMEAALERLLQIDLPFRLVVVAGKNEKMRERLAAIAGPRAEVHGFVTNVQDFMARSDLILTKAGGLTVSECLARALPMVIFSPVPGQEEANADYLLERGAAVKARTLDVLDYKVRELLENPARLDMMRRAASAVARPYAGREILRHVLDENSARG
jgi:processive 1,2-diacylglycerol beta-glucosyltransferase